MQSSESFLSHGLPPRLENISDCPIEASEYSVFEKGAWNCLLKVQRICTSGLVLEINQWPMVAVLFAHEDPNAPYTSTRCARASAEILKDLVIPEGIIEKVFVAIRFKLSKESWKHHVGEKYILESICKRSPNTKEQLGLISNISNSHFPEDQRLAAVCLAYLVNEVSHEDGKQSQANAILDALLRLVRGRELEVLRPAFMGIHQLLFVSRSCHSRRSEVYSHLLRNSALAISVGEKKFYAEILRTFTEALKLAGREFALMTLDVLESWTAVRTTRYYALVVLLSMLSQGVIVENWKRVTKTLLDCAIACEKGDESATLILACRELIRTIRTVQESQSERDLFKRIE